MNDNELRNNIEQILIEAVQALSVDDRVQFQQWLIDNYGDRLNSIKQ